MENGHVVHEAQTRWFSFNVTAPPPSRPRFLTFVLMLLILLAQESTYKIPGGFP